VPVQCSGAKPSDVLAEAKTGHLNRPTFTTTEIIFRLTANKRKKMLINMILLTFRELIYENCESPSNLTRSRIIADLEQVESVERQTALKKSKTVQHNIRRNKIMIEH
jgi:hypothetical protein